MNTTTEIQSSVETVNVYCATYSVTTIVDPSETSIVIHNAEGVLLGQVWHYTNGDVMYASDYSEETDSFFLSAQTPAKIKEAFIHMRNWVIRSSHIKLTRKFRVVIDGVAVMTTYQDIIDDRIRRAYKQLQDNHPGSVGLVTTIQGKHIQIDL